MPNTLAHIAVSRLLFSSVAQRIDFVWLYLGSIIPDFAWIGQRILRSIFPNIDTFDLRIYAIAQSSLLFSVIISVAIVLWTKRPRSIGLLLIAGSLVHLLLDATQIKWANGVHFFAPLSWELLNYGWYWPESVVTYILTTLGVIVVLLNWKHAVQIKGIFRISKVRVFISLFLVAMYFAAPFAFFNAIENADCHYVQTLRDSGSRKGKIIEFDRVQYQPGGDQPYIVSPFGQEKIILHGLNLEEMQTISIKGVFLDEKNIEVREYHAHVTFLRDGATIVGLSLLLAMLVQISLRNSRIINE